MGLFDDTLSQFRAFLDRKEEEGNLRQYQDIYVSDWPRAPGIILRKDTGIELGNPSIASQYFLLWTEKDLVTDGTVTLIGPDLNEATLESIPFAQVVLVRGRFSDEYEGYRELRDALYELKLWGFATRSLPGRRNIWCRVSRDALKKGFSLKDLGGALIQELKRIPKVEAAEVTFVTSSKSDVDELKPLASNVGEIVEALIKMYEEMVFDCEACDYREVCDSVKELKEIREKLLKRRKTDG